MNTPLANRVRSAQPSASIAAKARVDLLRASGRKIIDFTLGEPDFPTPAHIVAGAVKALAAGHTRYTSSAGTPALRKAIAAKLARENGLTFSPDQIVVGCGAKHIIHTALAATLNEGDEVIVPAPYWVSYPDMVRLQGGIPVIAPSDAATGFKLSAATLEAAITPRTRWLILNTPSNPTGAVYTRFELEALCAVLRAHPHVGLMTDEIYEHFTYSAAPHLSPLNVASDLSGRTLIINGVSKAYAMTGWRLGYGAGPVDLMKAMAVLLSQSTSCAAAVSQAAAIVALEGPQQCVAAGVQLFKGRRNRMVELLNRIPGINCQMPDGAFYAFPSVEMLTGKQTPAGKALACDVDVASYFLEEAGVATVDGSSFGMPGYLRLSFATTVEEIEAGCAALAQAVEACG